MPQRISAIAHEYARGHYAKGDPFECDAGDVKLMLALGRIVPERGEPGFVDAHEEERTYETRDLVSRAARGRPRTRAA